MDLDPTLYILAPTFVVLVLGAIAGLAVLYNRYVRGRFKNRRIRLCDECAMPYKRRSLARSAFTRILFIKKSQRVYLCPACANLERAIVYGTKPSSWLRTHWKPKSTNSDTGNKHD